jgi:hypothetical protein
LELKLPLREALAGMQVLFGLIEKTRNLQVEMINLEAPAKEIAGRTHLQGLFQPFLAQNCKPAVIL